MKKLQSTLYPLLLLVLFLGLTAVGLGLFQFTVWIEPQSPDTSLPMIGSPSEQTPAGEKVSPTLPTASPSLPTPATSPSKSLDLAAGTAGQGALRVSNPTEHPVRLALLTRQTQSKGYREPAHWDFAPSEGGSQGLILSLPKGKLRLSKGDILVAFAQDGSRQYWGPYVVGETPIPIWNNKTSEWQLILRP